MSDDVGQRVSSEAGGQEREALERLRSYLAVAPIGSLFDRSTQMLLRDVLAALDAERSRAEQWERDAKTNGEMYQGEYERHQQTKACIRELEEENLALRVALRWIERKAWHKDGASLGELSSRLYDIGYHAAFALSQATKRET